MSNDKLSSLERQYAKTERMVRRRLPVSGEATRGDIYYWHDKKPTAKQIDVVRDDLIARGLLRIEKRRAAYSTKPAEWWVWTGSADDVVPPTQQPNPRTVHADCGHPATGRARRECRNRRAREEAEAADEA